MSRSLSDVLLKCKRALYDIQDCYEFGVIYSLFTERGRGPALRPTLFQNLNTQIETIKGDAKAQMLVYEKYKYGYCLA